MNATPFLEILLSVSVQAAVIVVLTQVLCRLTGNARTRCRLWTTTYILLLGLAAAAVALPHYRMFHPWQNLSEQATIGLALSVRSIGRLVLGIWLAGVTVSLLMLVLGWYRAVRFVRRCRPLDCDLLPLEGLDDAIPGGRVLRQQGIRVVATSLVSGPFCWQLHRPYIVLPEFLLKRDARELRFVIRHELEHLRTGHPMQLFLQRVVEIVFWFHPLLWWASFRSNLSREFLCDEAAAGDPSNIAAYLQTMLALAEQNLIRRYDSMAALAFGRGKGVIARRTRRLVELAEKNTAPQDPVLRSRIMPALLVTAALAVSLIRVPIDVLASSGTGWSPWPTWTATVLQDAGISVRDYDLSGCNMELYELLEKQASAEEGE